MSSGSDGDSEALLEFKYTFETFSHRSLEEQTPASIFVGSVEVRTQVVDSKLHVKAVFCPPCWTSHDSSIVDEHIHTLLLYKTTTLLFHVVPESA